MSDKPTMIQDEITRVISETLKNSDFITEMISDKIKTAIESAIEDMFKWGDAKKEIEKKLNEIMIPAIKSYDFGEYVQRLDIVMDELLHSPNVICNNKILNNFKTIMTPPDIKSLTLKQLFAEYCNFVAKNLDTDGRDINYDNGEPEYEPIECIMESENTASTWAISNGDECYRLSFYTGEDGAKSDYSDTLNVDVELRRWSWMPADEYRLQIKIDPHSLRYMSDFESYLYSLNMANINVKLNSDENLKSGIYEDELVLPDKAPEPDYH